MKEYFLDTYALREIIAGNPRYKKYSEIKMVTTLLNLMEFYYTLARTTHPKFAEKYYDYFHDFIIPVDKGIVQAAMDFRLTVRKKKLSYVDCVGYIMAQRMGVPFLTGDKEFKGIKGIEFVR